MQCHYIGSESRLILYDENMTRERNCSLGAAFVETFFVEHLLVICLYIFCHCFSDILSRKISNGMTTHEN